MWLALAQGSGELIWWPFMVSKYGLWFLFLLVPACLLQWPGLFVRVDGHTDASGPESVNTSLGLGRAQSVAAFLLSLGLAPALASEPFRMGHVAIGVALSYSDFRFPALEWRKGRKALADWHASFEKRPSYRADPFFDEIAAAAAAAAARDKAANGGA